MVEGGECSMQAVLSEKRDLRGVNDEDARDCSRFEGLGDEVDELPMSST